MTNAVCRLGCDWCRSATVHHAQVIVLRMVKPPSFKAVPGMFIFLNLPCIAKSGARACPLLWTGPAY